jgi:ethanolamine utilization protein EutQ (cupin superfamily)
VTSRRTVAVFRSEDVAFVPFREVDRGHQSLCEWVGVERGAGFVTGIAELARIEIADYRFAFDDFLYVVEGGVEIEQAGETESLRPGDALHIPCGAVVTIRVPTRLVWIYCAQVSGEHWKDHATAPGAVRAM